MNTARDNGDATPSAVARNSAFVMSASGVRVGLLVAEMIVLARWLGPAEFGVFVLLVAYPEAIQQLLDCRVHEAMARFMPELLARDERRRACGLLRYLWRIDVAVAIAAFAIVAATAPLAARFLVHSPDVAWLIVVYGAGQLAASLDGAAGSLLRAMNRFRRAAAAGVAASVARFGLVVGSLVFDLGLPGLVWARLGAEVFGTLLLGSVALHAFAVKIGPDWRAPATALGDRRREVRQFLLHANLTGTIKLAGTKLDVLLVGALSGPATAGMYKVATQLATAPLHLTDAVNLATFPTLARMAALRAYGGIASLTRRLTLAMVALIVPPAIIASVWRDDLLAAVVGATFRPAALPFVVLLWAVVPAAALFWMRPLLLSLGAARPMTAVSAVTVAIQLALVAMLTPSLGALGAAVAAATGMVAHVAALAMLLARSSGAPEAWTESERHATVPLTEPGAAPGHRSTVS